MKFEELDKTQKYINGHAYFLEHKGKTIFVNDYNGMKGEEYEKVTEEMYNWLLPLDREPKSGLNLVDCTSTSATNKVIENLKKTANNITKRTSKKTAVLGLSSLQHIFLTTISKISGATMRSFKTKEEALDWLVEE